MHAYVKRGRLCVATRHSTIKLGGRAQKMLRNQNLYYVYDGHRSNLLNLCVSRSCILFILVEFYLYT